MKAIIALEELIKKGEAHLKLAKKQIADHESGVNKMSTLLLASAESTVEETTEQLERHREKLNELMQQDIQELEKQEQLKEAIQRKNYYHYQKVRLKRDITRSNDEKLEAMMIIDELPNEVQIEDETLFDIAEQSIRMKLSLHERIHDKFKEIKDEFDDLIKDLKDEDIKELGLLNYQIPVLVLHMHTLIANIEDNLEEDEKPQEMHLPKFEDWWIVELWTNHQAYYGLYKWKEIISKFCITADQKRAWDVIFANWIAVKKQITSKGLLGFKYNYAFDTVMRNHTGLEDELATSSLESMDEIIDTLIKKEDFSEYKEDHNIITPYVNYKREVLDYQDVKKKTAKKKKDKK